jgi:hypothetical protein
MLLVAFSSEGEDDDEGEVNLQSCWDVYCCKAAGLVDNTGDDWACKWFLELNADDVLVVWLVVDEDELVMWGELERDRDRLILNLLPDESVVSETVIEGECCCR